MPRRRRHADQRGFTLLELALVLGILALLTAAVAPYAAVGVRNQAAEKVAREMLAIADAAKSYYVANSAWPASIAALQTAGYLPSGWSATNPFGNTYTISSATTLTVTTTVPTDVAPAVTRLVPLGTQTAVAGGVSVAGTWPRPGQSSDLASATFPRNVVVFYDGTNCADAGLVALASAEGRVIVGRPPGGTLGGTVGTALANLENRPHTHPYSDVIAHTHGVSDPGHTHSVSDPGHTHSVSDPGHDHWLSTDNSVDNGNPGADFPLAFLYPGANYTGNIANLGRMRSTTAVTTGITVGSRTTGIGIGASGTGISITSTGVGLGTTNPTSATMPYVQLTACKKS